MDIKSLDIDTIDIFDVVVIADNVLPEADVCRLRRRRQVVRCQVSDKDNLDHSKALLMLGPNRLFLLKPDSNGC